MKTLSTLCLISLVIIVLMPVNAARAQDPTVEMESPAPSLDLPDNVKETNIKCLKAIGAYLESKKRVDHLMENRTGCAEADVFRHTFEKLEDLKRSIANNNEGIMQEFAAKEQDIKKKCNGALPHQKCDCRKAQRNMAGKVAGLRIGTGEALRKIDIHITKIKEAWQRKENSCKRYEPDPNLTSHIYTLCNARAQVCSICEADALPDSVDADLCSLPMIKPMPIEVKTLEESD